MMKVILRLYQVYAVTICPIKNLPVTIVFQRRITEGISYFNCSISTNEQKKDLPLADSITLKHKSMHLMKLI